MTSGFVAPQDMPECETRLDILDHDQTVIKGQIATACLARNEGQRIDELWLKRARHARQAKLEEMQQLRSWMRQARQAAGVSMQSEIIKVCRERFDASEWAEITMLAEERARVATTFTERNGL